MTNGFRTPPLNSLKVFSVVAKHESISKAALDLNLTESAVSRQIKNIEENLNFSLFTRRSRRIYLTEEGEILQRCCTKIFTELDNTLKNLSYSDSKEPLVVSCEPTLTMNWLIPNLPKFHELHPDIPIRIFAAGGDIDLSTERVDIALRRNDFTWNRNYFSEKVCDELIGPVCSENHWKIYEKGKSPMTILHTKSRFDAWQKWLSNTPKETLLIENEMIFEHFYLCLQAATSNLGFAITSIYMCPEELKAKKLMAPFSFIKDGSSYHLLSETPITHDSRKNAFYQWAKSEFANIRSTHFDTE
ncbi:LysR family transcriptional regulator [Marinomonas sp. FW-1]|uniref:LysR family transcriptional regulator n=1 Tax=Marinomonas sp. FW-1 TaxID=2071621 RepID=UPI0010C06C56|nr:LysR family transcriptional regulator [Marinomonas sp. FW-1]